MTHKKIKNIIESLLFVSQRPLTADQIKTVIPEVPAPEIKEAIMALVNEYSKRDGGFHLAEIAGGFQFRTKPEYKEWVKALYNPSPFRLSKAALETLTIIAYKQPLIRSDIEYIRGVDSGGVIRNLLDLKLIRVLGRKDIPGRPLIYATSKHFLEVFGLNDIKDLPTLKEIEELGKHSEAESDPARGDNLNPKENVNKTVSVDLQDGSVSTEKALT